MILHKDGRVQGTPEELARWQEIQNQKVQKKLFDKLGQQDELYFRPAFKCPNKGQPCFCDGTCMGLTDKTDGAIKKYT